MSKSYVVFFAMVLTIPVFLGINAWQSNVCGVIRGNISRIEREQETLVEENRTVAAEIADLLAVDRLENDAVDRLGMTRVSPENVMLIILGGDGHGR